MEVLITSGIEIKVETAFQSDHSNPEENEYIFAYKITISNLNTFPVQLLRRKWEITNALGDMEIVEGEGVVGRQPVLMPGEMHEYVSGCHIQTTIGKMDGHYIFINKHNGQEFEAKIPLFRLEVPFLLN